MLNLQCRFNDFDPPIPFLTGDASALHSIICEVDRVLGLPPNKIKERQAHYLLPLMKHFAKGSPDFANRLTKDPESFGSGTALEELLNLVEPQAKPYFQSLQAKHLGVGVPLHHLPASMATTSGSTGMPLKVRQTAINRAITMAQIPWMHLASGTDFRWRMASVKPTNSGIEKSESWDPASSLLFDVGPLLSISSGLDVKEQLGALHDYQPELLVVFPSVLKEYVGIWRNGAENPLNLKVIRTMGETLRDDVRELAEQVTGAAVLDTYSSSEVGRIATQLAPNNSYSVNTYSLIVEILDEEGERCVPGEIGRVVVTDLMNYATPMVRYDTGDWAIAEDSHHHLLRAIMGRSRNMLTLPNGKKVWPIVGYRDFSEVVPVKQFHIRQTAPDTLEAKFSVARLPDCFDKEKVNRIIRDSLGYDFKINSTYQTEPLSKGPNQKLEDFVSLCL